MVCFSPSGFPKETKKHDKWQHQHHNRTARTAALLRIMLFHRLLIFPEAHFRYLFSMKDQKHQNQENNNPTPAKSGANAKDSFYCEAHEFKRKQDEPTDKKD